MTKRKSDIPVSAYYLFATDNRHDDVVALYASQTDAYRAACKWYAKFWEDCKECEEKAYCYITSTIETLPTWKLKYDEYHRFHNFLDYNCDDAPNYTVGLIDIKGATGYEMEVHLVVGDCAVDGLYGYTACVSYEEANRIGRDHLREVITVPYIH